MVAKQESGRYYAHCPCGVCGKPRVTRAMAIVDDKAHREVCTTKGRAT